MIATSECVYIFGDGILTKQKINISKQRDSDGIRETEIGDLSFEVGLSAYKGQE